MTGEWFGNWNSICARRTERNQRPVSPTGIETDDINSTLPIFRAAVEKNLDRIRRRYSRARAMPFSQAAGPITLGNGEIIQVPSGDEPAPAERDSPPGVAVSL